VHPQYQISWKSFPQFRTNVDMHSVPFYALCKESVTITDMIRCSTCWLFQPSELHKLSNKQHTTNRCQSYVRACCAATMRVLSGGTYFNGARMIPTY